jgi:CoA:oxalate CoA-transferase
MSGARPLAGVVVADFTSLVAGPWCTRLLADCGAEVIKIEAAGDGDILRLSPPIEGGISRVWAHFNCGKRSIALDLKSAEGLDLARRIVAKADVLVENYRPGVMARLGLDYPTVAQANPGIVYCSVSGFGQTGERAGQAAYAPVVHALSGFDHVMMRAQGADAPLISGIMIADVVAGAYAFGAVQTAIVHRERHGLGSQIDASLMESMMSLVAIQYQEAQSPTPLNSRRFKPIRALDGWIVAPLVSVKNFHALYAVIGRPDWREAYGAMREIMKNTPQIETALAEWAGTRTTAEVEAALTGAGIPCSLYRAPGDMLADEGLRRRGSFARISDPGGAYVVQNAPFQFASGQIAANPQVSGPGDDTEGVLAGLLGLDVEAIAAARRAGAFG